MKRLFYSLIIAAVALLPIACEKEPVPNTGDTSGNLYGTWVLDTKTVDIATTNNGKTDSSHDSTDFTDEHFLLHLTDYFMAFAQKGTLLTFDIDDLDGTPYTYNSGLNQISFTKSLSLSAGFLPMKLMTLSGTYDVAELTSSKLVLKKVDEVKLNNYSTTTTTSYIFHRLIEKES